MAACNQPSGLQFEPTPASAAAQRPNLQETKLLRRARARAVPDAERLAASGADLTARAAALRRRAAELDVPVIAPDRRDRLLGAASQP